VVRVFDGAMAESVFAIAEGWAPGGADREQ
jgi:hypothetical protein